MESATISEYASPPPALDFDVMTDINSASDLPDSPSDEPLDDTEVVEMTLSGGHPAIDHSPGPLKADPVLDVDLGWLGRLQFEDRPKAMQGILDRYRRCEVVDALHAYLADIEDVTIQCFPEIKDQKERKKRYFEIHLPERIARQRQRLSEYRMAGRNAITYAEDIAAVGIDLFQDEIITKLIDLGYALKHHDNKPEVFNNLKVMGCATFHLYSRGKPYQLKTDSDPLRRYLDAYEHQRSVLSV